MPFVYCHSAPEWKLVTDRSDSSMHARSTAAGRISSNGSTGTRISATSRESVLSGAGSDTATCSARSERLGTNTWDRSRACDASSPDTRPMPEPVWHENVLGIDTGVHIDDRGYGHLTIARIDGNEDRDVELRSLSSVDPSTRPHACQKRLVTSIRLTPMSASVRSSRVDNWRRTRARLCQVRRVVSGLPTTGKGCQTGRVLLHRNGTIAPLPWSTFAPPFAEAREALLIAVQEAITDIDLAADTTAKKAAAERASDSLAADLDTAPNIPLVT